MQAKLIAETTSLQRGHSGWLAVRMTMKPGWHTYWRNPGDSGTATSIRWTLPAGVTAGPIVWPQPARFVARTIVGYGYSSQVALLSAITLPPKFASKQLEVGAVVSWLACENVCIPGSEKLSVSIPVSDAAPVADAGQVALFADARRRIPRSAPFKATFVMDDEQIRLSFPKTALDATAKTSVTFYPFDNTVIEHAAPQVAVVGARQIEVLLRRSVTANDQIATLAGLLIVEPAAGTRKSRAFEVSAWRVAASPAR